MINYLDISEKNVYLYRKHNKTVLLMAKFTHFDSLFQLTKHFNNNETCIEFLEKHYWSDGIVCPYCGMKHAYKRSDGRYICNCCGKSFSVLVGTIFEGTKLPLVKWFMAIYLISSHKNGISSCQLARDIDVTQKSAWYMLQKIRTRFVQNDLQITGIAEADETYIGGRETNKHKCKQVKDNQGRSLKTKSAVFGIAERGGNVVAYKVPDTKVKTLKNVIYNNCVEGCKLFTDEYGIYNNISNKFEHQIVHHHSREFAVGNVNTNTIEGFWAQVERMIFSTYHFVSKAYLQRYIDEAVFRYNTRNLTEGERFQILLDKAMGVYHFNNLRMVA